MKRKYIFGLGVAFISLALIITGLLTGVWLQISHSTHVRADAPGASVSTLVQVPANLRSAPFDTNRYLNVPPNFSVSVYARINTARFMAVAPNNDLLVAQPGPGKVELIRNGNVSDFVTGLTKPQGLAFHTSGNTTYLYIAESNQVDRFLYNSGDTTAHDRQIIVTGLPDSSLPELHGSYGHELKDIVFDANSKLYVSIGSTCNACTEDATSNPVRGSIYQYNDDGSGGRLYARGLRNAEGLALLPGTNTLWAAVNNRDNIAYPFNDATGNYGKVMQSYVDNHPPEEFTSLRDGGNYGWPFCNPNPDNGVNTMPFDQDYQFNADGHVNCGGMDRIAKGIQAHSAPLGLAFLQNTQVPAAYRNGAVITLHGSWDRAQKTGYKVVYFPWDANAQAPGNQSDLVTGWLDDGSQTSWGRPVDTVVDQQGNFYISDDASGTVYKMTYTAPSGPIDPNGVYKIVNQNSGKLVDVTGGATDDGTHVIQWSDNGGANQHWKFVDAGNGYYKIVNQNSGKILDVAGASTDDGIQVIQWSDHNGSNQLWKLVDAGGGYYKIVNQNSNKLLAVNGKSQNDGDNIIQGSDDGSIDHLWKFVQI